MQALRNGVYAALLMACFLTAAGLSGCEALGGRVDVDSATDAILESKAAAKSYAMLLGDLLDRGVITADQAAEQLEHLRTIERELNLATDTIEATGDPLAAGTRLERADRTLSLVLAFLADHVEEG